MGSYHDFLSSYLFDQCKLIKIGKCKSTLLPVESGVPQASISWAIFLNIYVNDVGPLDLSSLVFYYADDTIPVLPSNNLLTAIPLIQVCLVHFTR